VVDAFTYDAPKTSRLAAFVERLGATDQKLLILTDGVKSNLHLSGRNLPTVHVLPYSDVSAYHILWSDVVVIEGSAIGQTLEPIVESEPEPKAKKTPAARTEPAKTKKSAAKKAAPKKVAAKKAAKQAAPARSAKKKAASAKTTAAKKAAAKPKKKGK
jgi:hypothetical protein